MQARISGRDYPPAARCWFPLKTNDAVLAWQAGLPWAFINGVIVPNLPIGQARRAGGYQCKSLEVDETYFGKRENPKPSKHRKGRPFNCVHRPSVSFTATASCLSEKGFGRKWNFSFSGRFLRKASSA